MLKSTGIPIVILACINSFALAVVQRVFFVSPTGRDSNDGSESAPFRMIERARDAVRATNADMTGDIVVVLRGGIYELEKPFRLEGTDSGTNGHSVIYRAEAGQKVILSGGRHVTGWKAEASGRWKAVSPVEDFRQLYVNSVRATRARGPAPAGIALHGNDGYGIPQADLAQWRNQDDIELVYHVVWTWTRLKVRRITQDDSAAIVTMQQPSFEMARTKEGVRVDVPKYMENALELLDEPGEWYLDRTSRTIWYIPRPDEDLGKAEVIAPALETLVELSGTLDRPVRNIRFEDLRLEHATWLQPNRIGHPDVQANFLNDPAKPLERDGTVTTVHNEQLKSPSNIICRAARGVQFRGCTFAHLGGGGIDLEHGSQDNVICGCEFTDISGTAIQVGDVLKDDHHPSDERLIVKNNTVVNNYIHDCCVEYRGGVGVFVGYTDSTTIAHNEICRLPYSGVSVGWGWGEEDAGGGAYSKQGIFYDKPTTCRNNRIEFNHIHHVMQSLNDGGGIYTLGNQPGTIIRGNHVHDNPGAPGGIYLDEGSGFIEITGNCVYGVSRPMNYNNRAQNRIATCEERGNFFDVPSPTWGAIQEVLDKAGLEKPFRHLLGEQAQTN